MKKLITLHENGEGVYEENQCLVQHMHTWSAGIWSGFPVDGTVLKIVPVANGISKILTKISNVYDVKVDKNHKIPMAKIFFFLTGNKMISWEIASEYKVSEWFKGGIRIRGQKTKL